MSTFCSLLFIPIENSSSTKIQTSYLESLSKSKNNAVKEPLDAQNQYGWKKTGPSQILLSFKCRSIAYHSYQNEFFASVCFQREKERERLKEKDKLPQCKLWSMLTMEVYASSNLWSGGDVFFCSSFTLGFLVQAELTHQL